MNPTSNWSYVKGANPLRSRSTVICLASLLTFIILVLAVVKAGYWDASFGAVAMLFLREITANALGHQLKTDVAKIAEKGAVETKASP